MKTSSLFGTWPCVDAGMFLKEVMGLMADGGVARLGDQLTVWGKPVALCMTL